MTSQVRVFAIIIALLSANLLAFGPAAATEPPSGPVVAPAVLNALAGGGVTDFWVVLSEQAELSQDTPLPNWDEQGEKVVTKLTEVAESSQQPLVALLDSHGAVYETFWIVNTVRVTGDRVLLDDILALPGIAEIAEPKVYALETPEPVQAQQTINAIEWGVDYIQAPNVWTNLGVNGSGIVVASIDTGVDYDHPALVNQYRGNLGGGNFDHNYNWHDPSNICGNPSLAPCDNNDHGTHVTGTMVGDDGGTNQIGVAPGAKWIAAKGCESTSCSDNALLSSGQWMLAPTDLSGNNPNPAMRPHIVNNSWGGGGGDFWYQATVAAWIASGMFPMFAIGNSGSNCGTAGSPGDYAISYASGAHDVNGDIAGFSSRGAAATTGIIKPNISAPGVAVRSSVNGGGYGAFNGTSMASPHVAGVIALMWSAGPLLVGDIDATRAILDQTAVDVDATGCGGTIENNNIHGEGRLNALAAVAATIAGGALEGVITDAVSGDPITSAIVEITGPSNRSLATDGAGFYTAWVPEGIYTVSVTAFGYEPDSASNLSVVEGEATTANLALTPLPSFTISGIVRDVMLNPLEGAAVTVDGTPLPAALTDGNGFYSIPNVPEGDYTISATPAVRCHDNGMESITVDGPETLDFFLDVKRDDFGHICRGVTPAYTEVATLVLTGDDAEAQVALPFQFTFYGQTYTDIWICTNGYIAFIDTVCAGVPASFTNRTLPDAAAPNTAIYPFWDDLNLPAASAGVYTGVSGVAPNRTFTIEYRNSGFFGNLTNRIDVQVVLHETDGLITVHYRNIDDAGRERGDSATIGIENHLGNDALQYSFNEAVLPVSNFTLQFVPDGVGIVRACLFAGSLSQVRTSTQQSPSLSCGRGTEVLLERGADYFACLFAGSLSQFGTSIPSNCGRGAPVSFAAGTDLYGCAFAGSLSRVGTSSSPCSRGTLVSFDAVE